MGLIVESCNGSDSLEVDDHLLRNEVKVQELNNKVLRLSKENLKFSSAHFLIIDENRAERLHGHNYRVQVAVKVNWTQFTHQGYGIDFAQLKKIIKDQVDLWDERVLLPAQRGDMDIKTDGKSLELKFRDRHYVFPENEVVLLPILNTSVELLSGLLCDLFWKEMAPLGVLGIRVQVEETLGQAAESTIGEI
jgi:6-pyruvoyltetrahydropterin/6-carboxytetrahydropterin synthase